jgi:hypothetical protein
MHVGAGLGKRRIGIGVRGVLTREQRNGPIGTVNILLYIMY